MTSCKLRTPNTWYSSRTSWKARRVCSWLNVFESARSQSSVSLLNGICSFGPNRRHLLSWSQRVTVSFASGTWLRAAEMAWSKDLKIWIVYASRERSPRTCTSVWWSRWSGWLMVALEFFLEGCRRFLARVSVWRSKSQASQSMSWLFFARKKASILLTLGLPFDSPWLELPPWFPWKLGCFVKPWKSPQRDAQPSHLRTESGSIRSHGLDTENVDLAYWLDFHISWWFWCSLLLLPSSPDLFRETRVCSSTEWAVTLHVLVCRLLIFRFFFLVFRPSVLDLVSHTNRLQSRSFFFFTVVACWWGSNSTLILLVEDTQSTIPWVFPSKPSEYDSLDSSGSTKLTSSSLSCCRFPIQLLYKCHVSVTKVSASSVKWSNSKSFASLRKSRRCFFVRVSFSFRYKRFIFRKALRHWSLLLRISWSRSDWCNASHSFSNLVSLSTSTLALRNLRFKLATWIRPSEMSSRRCSNCVWKKVCSSKNDNPYVKSAMSSGNSYASPSGWINPAKSLWLWL